jgi:hypothetical protein
MRTKGDRYFLITGTRSLAAAFCLSITLAAQGQYSPPTASKANGPQGVEYVAWHIA